MNLLPLLFDSLPTDESVTFVFTANIVTVVTLADNDAGVSAEGASVADVTPALTGLDHITLADAASLTVTVSATETATSSEIASPLVPPAFSPVLGDVATSKETVSVGRFVWTFTPPTRGDIFQIENSLFVTIQESMSVLKTGNSYTTSFSPLPETIGAADIAYLGGRSYVVSDTEKASLMAAGYGAYVALAALPG